MLRKQQASLAFIETTATGKTSLGQTVIAALTDNATTFPNLPVAITTLAANNEDLTGAVLAARTGDHVAVANLENVIKTWDNNFRLTANYVSIVANGNEATIRLAGFTATKAETTPAQIPAAPSRLRVNINGSKGKFTAACDRVNGARGYVFAALPNGATINFNGNIMMVTIGNTTAYITVNTRSRAQFTNLPSGAQMDVSVYAVNSAGSGTAANGQNVITQ